MADLRIPSTTIPAVQRPQAPARVDAAKAAQRAFFQAAMGDQTPASTRPAAAKAPAQLEAPTQRLPRPGSLLDIKV